MDVLGVRMIGEYGWDGDSAHGIVDTNGHKRFTWPMFAHFRQANHGAAGQYSVVTR